MEENQTQWTKKKGLREGREAHGEKMGAEGVSESKIQIAKDTGILFGSK